MSLLNTFFHFIFSTFNMHSLIETMRCTNSLCQVQNDFILKYIFFQYKYKDFKGILSTKNYFSYVIACFVLILKHIFIFFWGYYNPFKLPKIAQNLVTNITDMESMAPELVFQLDSTAPELVFHLMSMAPELVFQLESMAPKLVFQMGSTAPRFSTNFQAMYYLNT